MSVLETEVNILITEGVFKAQRALMLVKTCYCQLMQHQR